MRSDFVSLQAYIDGDSNVVREVDRWIRAATASFRSRLGRDWEDLIQNIHTELMAITKRNGFHIESSLKAYIWKVSNHRGIDAMRRRQRMMRYDIDAQMDPSHHPNLLMRMIGRDTARLALSVMKMAKPACQDIWQRIIAGQSYAQMSSALGISEGALRVKALRCRKQAANLRDRIMKQKNVTNPTVARLYDEEQDHGMP